MLTNCLPSKAGCTLLMIAMATAGCSKPTPPKPPAPRVAARVPVAPPVVEPPPPGITSPAPAPVADEAERVSTAESDAGIIELVGLTMDKPVSWAWQAPSLAFRTLQYSVPAPDGRGGAAELVFSVFRAGDGGPLQANIDRWIAQFRTAEGAAATPKQCELTVGKLTVHRIDLEGTYKGMGAAAGRPDWAQLGAIVEAPGGNVFIRLLGPRATVEAQHAAFEAMVASLRDSR